MSFCLPIFVSTFFSTLRNVTRNTLRNGNGIHARTRHFPMALTLIFIPSPVSAISRSKRLLFSETQINTGFPGDRTKN
jgi:hypothetical protein